MQMGLLDETVHAIHLAGVVHIWENPDSGGDLSNREN